MNDRVGIIGYGRFGKAFAKLLVSHQYDVTIFDNRTAKEDLGKDQPTHAKDLSDLAKVAQFLAICVPVGEIDGTIQALSPHLTEHHIVFDVGSVKEGPQKTLAKHLGRRIRWVATHPLFGPASLARGDRPLQVVVCPNKIHSDAFAAVSTLYRRLGCEVVANEASDHDRAMAETHALAFFIAKGLLSMGAGDGVAFSPPSFRALTAAIQAVRSDAGHLFTAIQQENPYAAQARNRLLQELAQINESLAAAQRGELTAPLDILPDR